MALLSATELSHEMAGRCYPKLLYYIVLILPIKQLVWVDCQPFCQLDIRVCVWLSIFNRIPFINVTCNPMVC